MRKIIIFCCLNIYISFVSYAQVIVNVQSGERQTFKGFGVSQVAFPGPDRDVYTQTPAAKRNEMADLVYTSLGSTILRMWGGPSKDLAMLQFYRDRIIPEAKLKGVTTFLLAPGIGEHAPSDYNQYGIDLADYIKWAIDNGLEITTTGLNNEPSLCTCDPKGWRFSGINTAVKALRNRLNLHGLSRIGIVAPEGANADNWLLDSFNSLKSDQQAWNSLQAVSSHSYSNATKEEHAQVAFQGGKEYWMTESSDNGTESETNAYHPYQTVARYLNDLNHGITHWIWFIGYYRNAANEGDGKTKLVNYDPATDKITAWPKYWYFKHINTVFPLGTVFRHSTSPQAGEMNRNGSDISNINVAVAKRPDGKLAIAITSAIYQSVTLNIAELASTANVTFDVMKSAVGNYQQASGTVIAANGKVTIQMEANQLLTLVTQGGNQNPVLVTGVSIAPSSTSISIGETKNLTPTISPSNATNQAVTYLSSNTAVATANANGLVTGVAAGTATVTVTTVDGSKTATSLITVVTSVPKTSYEAEEATKINADIATGHTGYSGTGFVEVFKAIGAGVEFAVSVGNAAEYNVGVKYANGWRNSSLSIYVNGVKVKQLSMPTTLSWDDWSTLTETLSLKAGANKIAYMFDAGDGAYVNLDKIDITSKVVITAPANNATFIVPASITINAEANGTVSNVQFYNGTTLLGSDATSPYSFVWSNMAAGTYSLTVKATDNAGAITTSSTVSVTVTTVAINVAPTVSITAPANNAGFTAPASITIAANAADADGTVSSVQFYNGTTLLGSDATSPYSFAWIGVAAGTYTITAKATDNTGAITTSAAVSVTVTTITSTADIIGPDCGTNNTTLSFQVNSAKRTNVTSYSWWYTGSATSTAVVADAPYSATIQTGANFSAGQVCVGMNLSVSPWYISYCKSITKCTGRMGDMDEFVVSTVDESTISPNPSQEKFIVNGKGSIKSLTVVNELGKEVYQQFDVQQRQMILPGENFLAGIYILTIEYYDGSKEFKKIVKIN